MTNAMKYWIEEFDIDGYRFDQAYAVPQSFFDKTFKSLRALKPIFLLAETDIEHPGGIELVSKFDASYHSGNYFLKQIAQGNMTVTELESHFKSVMDKHKDENILLNYTSTHDVNSWQGTSIELYGDAYKMLTAFTYIFPGMPLLYTGQEYDLNKRLLFFEKDDFIKKTGQTMRFLQKLGKLKNTNDALSAGAGRAAYQSLTGLVNMNYGKENQIFTFKRTSLKNEVILIANMSKNYAQFTMNFNGKFKNFSDGKFKKLSDSYEYVMKPWEYWILLN
jgi:glycosidase